MDAASRTAILASLADELNGAYLYDALALAEKDERLAEVYKRMADAERRHAAAWSGRLKKEGIEPPAFKPGWRTQVLAWSAKRFGVAAVVPTITGLEQKDSRKYDGMPDASQMAADERSHGRLLQQVTSGMRGGFGGVALAQME